MAAAMAEEEVGQAQLTKCWWGEGKGGSSTDTCYKCKEEEGKDEDYNPWVLQAPTLEYKGKDSKQQQ